MNGTFPIDIPSADRIKYESFFNQLQTGGCVDGITARNFFMRSGLPETKLAEIWEAADLNRDGRLNFKEFCTAFYMTTAATRQRLTPMGFDARRLNSPLIPSYANGLPFRSSPASPVQFDPNRERRKSATWSTPVHEKPNNGNQFDFSVFAQTLPKETTLSNGIFPASSKSVFPVSAEMRMSSHQGRGTTPTHGASRAKSLQNARRENLRKLLQQKRANVADERTNLDKVRLDLQNLNLSIEALSISLLSSIKSKDSEERSTESTKSELIKMSEQEEKSKSTFQCLNYQKIALEEQVEASRKSITMFTNTSVIDHTLDNKTLDMDILAARQKLVILREIVEKNTAKISSAKGRLADRKQDFNVLMNGLKNLTKENEMLVDVFQTKQMIVGKLAVNDSEVPSNIYEKQLLPGVENPIVISQPETQTRTVVAIADYVGGSENELTFSVGDEITLLKERSDGWWLGRKGSTAAYFPATYVKMKEAPPRLVALYDYQAQSGDELSFNANEILEVFPREDENDGWLLGRILGSENTGFIPANYLRSLDDEISVEDESISYQQCDSPKRKMAIEELYRTEQIYACDIQSVMDVFCETLKTSSVCTKEEIQEIFSGWDDLIACTQKLIHAMKSVANEQISIIGHVLCVSLPNPAPYILFCSRQVRMGELIHQKTTSNPKFDEVVRMCSQDPRLKGLPLSAAYVKPMQRITRYPLLIKRILETTPKGHIDYESVQEALKLAESLCEQVNEGVRLAEFSQRFDWLQKNVDLDELEDVLKFDSLTNSMKPRRLLYSGSLTKVKTGRELVAFLFNDFLLLTTPTKAMISSAGNFTFEKKLWASTKLKLYKKPLLVSRCSANMLPDEASCSVTFPNSSGVTLVLKATTATECRAWVKKLNESSEMELQQRPTPKTSRPPEGCCRIIVMEATELTADPQKKRCDAYCKISTETQENRTKVVQNSTAPKWDQNMNFIIYDMKSEALSVTVWDHNLYAPDRFLGRSELRLCDIIRNSHVPGIPILKRVLLHEVDSGEVALKLDVQRFSPN